MVSDEFYRATACSDLELMMKMMTTTSMECKCITVLVLGVGEGAGKALRRRCIRRSLARWAESS